jgi:hypothetical protein
VPYFAIFTTLGLTRLAEAQANNIPLVFTHVAVGDGDGVEITPVVGMTELVNERARVAVNLVEISPDAPTTVRVEGLIPAATGGFYIREAGLFNGDGELIAIASYPPIYKPTPGEGASVEEYIRIPLEYATTSAIALTVDTSVVIATRLYVEKRVSKVERGAPDFLFREEFLAALAAIWTAGGGGSVAVNADVSDAAAGGVWARHITINALGSYTLSTTAMPPGERDFAASFRARVPTFSGDAVVGFFLYNGVTSAGFAGNLATGRWDAVNLAGGLVDTGFSMATYRNLQVLRVAGVMCWFVDGSLVHSEDDSTDLSDHYLYLAFGRTASGTIDVYTDLVALWIDRGTESEAMPPLTSAHVESGYSPIVEGSGDGSDYLDVVFDLPFAGVTGENGYFVEVDIYNSYGDIIAYSIGAKTVEGFRILFSGSFNGEVRWRAS